jgi:hypothetical protein
VDRIAITTIATSTFSAIWCAKRGASSNACSTGGAGNKNGAGPETSAA